MHAWSSPRPHFTRFEPAHHCGFCLWPVVPIRSNGLLWGILYLYDLVCFFFPALALTAPADPSQPPRNGNRASREPMPGTKPKGKLQQQGSLWELFRILVGGGFIALAFFGVQLYTYRVYRTCRSSQPVCAQARVVCVPAASHLLVYPVTLLEHWTVPLLDSYNIPNFLFALPTLYLMYLSAIASPPDGGAQRVLMPLRIVQIVMLISALLTWHVQIVTRVVSSTSPLIYWFVEEGLRKSKSLKKARFARRVVRFWMVWIVVQGLLFSVYLPPA